MSEATPNREWRFYLDDMIGFGERVQIFTRGIDQIQFVGDAMRFDATVRNIELLGEAATHIPERVRLSTPAIPWRMVIATRNKLIHGFWVSITTRSGALLKRIFRCCWPACGI